MKQYIVELTSEERCQLQQIVNKGNTTGYRIKYAHILLKADQGKDGHGGSFNGSQQNSGEPYRSQGSFRRAEEAEKGV